MGLKKGFAPALPLALALVLASTTVAFAGQAPVDLGACASYGVLAREGISNTGASSVIGDLGVELNNVPGPGITVSGATNIGNPAATAAIVAARAAYADAESRKPTTPLAGGNLSGLTLPPGVYGPDATAADLVLDGTLTLDAQGDPNAVWVFQADSLLVDDGSRVVLANGARFCRVFWQVDGAADIGAQVAFVGHVLARGEANLSSGTTLRGQLIAIGYEDDGYYGGDIHLENNAIDNSGYVCATTATSTPSLPRTGYPSASGGGGPWALGACVLATLAGAGVLALRRRTSSEGAR